MMCFFIWDSAFLLALAPLDKISANDEFWIRKFLPSAPWCEKAPPPWPLIWIGLVSFHPWLAGNTNDESKAMFGTQWRKLFVPFVNLWRFVDLHIYLLWTHRCGAKFEVRLLSIQVSVSTWKEIVTNSTVLISRSPLNHQRCDILVTFAMERIQHSDRKGFGFSVCSQRISDKWLLQGDFNRRREMLGWYSIFRGTSHRSKLWSQSLSAVLFPKPLCTNWFWYHQRGFAPLP